MECHPLIPDIVQQVRANALATYLGLVEPVSGAVISRQHGFTLVRGPGIFSFCNFAAGFDTRREDLAETIAALRENAAQCSNFYVFVISGDTPSELEQALAEGGFESRQSLRSMTWAGAAPATENDLRFLTRNDERLATSRFMAQQFFWQMPEDAREAIALATAASRHQLVAVGPPSDPEAAMMLVPHEGTIGLFNLCVRPDLRGKGIGTEAVKGVQAGAAHSGSTVVLHCGSHLAAWYSGLGFKEVGSVATFTAASV